MSRSLSQPLNWLDRLRQSAQDCGHCLCLGIDPDPARCPGPGSPLERCRRLIHELLDELDSRGLKPAAYKPNLAYFERFGSSGLAWLEELLPRLRAQAPVILDAKRGDIGPSSQAYAEALFDTWRAEAVTVHPWMGLDSLQPFLDRTPERGVYVLLHTSNPGARDLQQQRLENGQPLWQQLRRLLSGEWHRPGLGAVAGATRVESLANLVQELGSLDFPLLIPGVGSQGGEAGAVLQALGRLAPLARVNCSSAILYAFEKNQKPPPQAGAEAFVQFAESLRLPILA